MPKARFALVLLLTSAMPAVSGVAHAHAASSAASARSAATARVAATAHAAGSCGNASLRPRRSNLGQIARITLCLVNRQRAAHGLRPLRDNAALDRAARGHSVDMVRRGYFSHTTPQGVSPFQRILGTGYSAGRRACAMGENIAAGIGSYSTPAGIVGMWMSSSGHRANILDGTYRDSGIGVAVGFPGYPSVGATFTQDFGRRC